MSSLWNAFSYDFCMWKIFGVSWGDRFSHSSSRTSLSREEIISFSLSCFEIFPPGSSQWIVSWTFSPSIRIFPCTRIQHLVATRKRSSFFNSSDILDLEWHNKVSVALFGFASGNSLDNNRGEGILVFEAHIVFSDNWEGLEEVFTVNSDDIFLSFDRSGETSETRTYLSISSRYFDFSFVFGSDSSIVVILSCYQVGLFEGIHEFTSENNGFASILRWEKCFIIRKFSCEESWR